VPSTTPETAIDAPIIAFFDVDNTLLRGASMFHMAKAARRKHIIKAREIIKFGWHQATFLFIGENNRQLGSIKGRAVEIIGGHTETELREIANEIFERDIKNRLWPETVGLTQEHLAKGHQVWLISATPRIVGTVIAERLGLTGALGTEFVTAEDGVFEGNFDGAKQRPSRPARSPPGSAHPLPTAGHTPTPATTSRCSALSATASS
jgi:HAD superfamily hydrolase (TIGR01490 family)